MWECQEQKEKPHRNAVYKQFLRTDRNRWSRPGGFGRPIKACRQPPYREMTPFFYVYGRRTLLLITNMAGSKSLFAPGKDQSPATQGLPHWRCPYHWHKRPFIQAKTARSAAARIKGVAQAVPHEIQGEQQRRQHSPGKKDHPPVNPQRVDLCRPFRKE